MGSNQNILISFVMPFFNERNVWRNSILGFAKPLNP